VRPILWHKGSDVEPVLPWWPDGGCLAAIEAVQRRAAPQPDMLPSLQALAKQGILACGSAETNGPTYLRTDPESGRAVFARERFVDLGQVLPPGQIAALRAYWQDLAALNVIPHWENDRARRGSHGEPSSVLLSHLLKPLVEHIVGGPIEPAYSFAWIYERGAEMPAHRDRSPCRYTVTLLADFAPTLEGPTPWPIHIRPRDGRSPVEIQQSVGDAILFCGQELEHFRSPLVVGERSTSLLLHYVDQEFSGVLF
jgi:hypothetical protein